MPKTLLQDPNPAFLKSLLKSGFMEISPISSTNCHLSLRRVKNKQPESDCHGHDTMGFSPIVHIQSDSATRIITNAINEPLVPIVEQQPSSKKDPSVRPKVAVSSSLSVFKPEDPVTGDDDEEEDEPVLYLNKKGKLYKRASFTKPLFPPTRELPPLVLVCIESFYIFFFAI